MAFQDYEEFIDALNVHGARYLIVGAHAVAYHARPRATKDLDILIEATAKNARKVLQSLKAFFGGAELDYTVEDLLSPQWVVQLGVAPVRIDLLSGISGLDSFETLWKRRVDAQFGTVSAHYLGLDDLIESKVATGRMQDRADVGHLRRAKRAKADKGSRIRPRKPKD
ncbi:MAG: nucleotidyltransferase [Candidatus Hydrogenedentales bacterium]|jgi:predicted nucleotidyltransferase